MNHPDPSKDSPDEPARDAWLSEALRHAPDADAAPSVAVRETILRQARAEAATSPRPPRPVTAWQRFNAVWSWLSGPRVAAGFASVMVATVVGVMWWDKPIDEALRSAEPSAVSVPAPAPAPAPAPTPAPAPAPAPQEATPPAPSAEPSRDLAATAPPRVTAERKREARPRADTANDTRREAPASLAAPRAADETRTFADTPSSARAEREAKELDAAREQRAETASEKAAAPALRSAPAAAAGAIQAPAPAVAPAPAPPPMAAAAPPRQARTAPLRALIEALGEESPRWRWQRDGASEQALTPQLQAWLQELDRALASRRSNADSAGLALAPDQGRTQELRLLRDGGVQAVVRFEADGRIRIEIAGQAPLTAQLPAASTSALRRALDDATR